MANEFKIKNGAIVQKLKPLSDSTTALQINTAGDTATILNIDSTNKRIGLNNIAPTFTLDISGNHRVTGLTAGSTVFDVSGTSGSLFSITDSQTGTLLQVSDKSGNHLLRVESEGYILQNSSQLIGVSTNIAIFTIPKINGSAAYIDYRVSNSTTGAYRSGTVMSVWDSINNRIDYTDFSTPDLYASTSDIRLITRISGANVEIVTSILGGTWNIKLGIRVI